MSWVEVKDGLKSEAKHEQEEWAISIMKFFDGISLRKENVRGVGVFLQESSQLSF